MTLQKGESSHKKYCSKSWGYKQYLQLNMRIFYSFKAAKQLSDLETRTQKRIAMKMRIFAQQSNPLVFAKYIAIQEVYRFRVGNYRIFFQVNNNVIFIQTIKRRDKAYD